MPKTKHATLPEVSPECMQMLFAATNVKLYRGKHAKSCECYECLKTRLTDYRGRVKAAVAGGARIESPDQTIPVRAHFRQGKNHLKKNPELRKLVLEIVREVMAQQKKQEG